MWVHNNRNEWCTRQAMDSAAESEHFDIVEWLHENRNEWCTTWAMDLAARNGHLDIVICLHNNRNEGRTRRAIDSCSVHRWHKKITLVLLPEIHTFMFDPSLTYENHIRFVIRNPYFHFLSIVDIRKICQLCYWKSMFSQLLTLRKSCRFCYWKYIRPCLIHR